MKFLKNNILNIFLSAVLTFFLYGSFYLLHNEKTVNCFLVNSSNMEKLKHNVYISPGASEEQKTQCNEFIKEAHNRVGDLWGSIESDPVYIFCMNFDDYYRYGMYRTEALSRMNVTGEYIIISPWAFNPDDVSHELCHAELFARVGYSNDQKIPLWFHEGLALMVCNDYPGSYEGYVEEWQIRSVNGKIELELSDITTDDNFYNSPNRSDLAYWRSGLEVSRWKSNAGNKGVLELVNLINEGKDFHYAYKLTEGKGN